MTSRTSFKKRQKEILRMEKQRDKAAKRAARKLMPKETGDVDPETMELNGGLPMDQAEGEPQAEQADGELKTEAPRDQTQEPAR